MNSEYITQGIILQTKNFKDEDKFYRIFTFERGLVSAVAKSVASTKSKLSGFLMPANVCIFMLAQGRAIHRIAQISVINSFDMSKNYKAFLSFNKISEILLNFLPEHIEEKYIYENTLEFLKDMNEDLYDLSDLENCYFLCIMRYFGFCLNDKVQLPSTERQIIDNFTKNTYLKNKELVLKLNYDKFLISDYIKNYFEKVLEKKLNSF
ncbi:MAG: DNA repair protein RecO [Patescibacteria group bacterium]|nr:DNA repair protein RecO [Patescibacteria group bacterium]